MKIASEAAEDYHNDALGGGVVVFGPMFFAYEPRHVHVN